MLSNNGMIECKARNEPPIKFERPGHDVNDYSLQDEIREFLSIKTRPILATCTFASLHAGRHAFGASKGTPSTRGAGMRRAKIDIHMN